MTVQGPARPAAPAPAPSKPKDDNWAPAPGLKEAIHGDYINKGEAGESVKQLQQMLQAQGLDVKADGKFGKDTEAAVRKFQAAHGCKVDGVVGPETLAALGVPVDASTVEGTGQRNARQTSAQQVGTDSTPRAPTQGQWNARPDGAVRAGDLARQNPARNTSNTNNAEQGAPVGTLTGPPPANAADAKLMQIQAQTMNSARKELAAGVKEDPGTHNRGARVDQYCKNAGMDVGGEWCGYFATFNYTQAAKETGMKFEGQTRMHSMEKARSFFCYDNYTNESKAEKTRNANLHEAHAADGSERKFMTLSGTPGDKWCNSNKEPHEVYKDAKDLPLRPGDTILFHTPGHVAQVEGYDPSTGKLTLIEGNYGNKVNRRTIDLNDPKMRASLEGFGRPALGDFKPV